MSTPGWYPDPAGEPNRYRYWSGTEWSATSSPTPGPTPAHRPGRSPWRWLGPLLGGVGVLIVAVALIVAFLMPGDADDGPGTVETQSTPTGSSWDETSTPSPSAGRPVECDINTPNELPSPPGPGSSLTVGHLSMPVPAGWNGPISETRVPFGRDAHGYNQVISSETKKAWASSMTIGVLTFPAGTSKESMVSTMAQCIVTSAFYTSVDVKVAEYSRSSTRISGHEAVQGDVLLTFNHPDLTTKGSSLRILAVDTSDAPQFFFSAVPMENAEHRGLVDATIAGLSAD